jgi:hypothetical protein
MGRLIDEIEIYKRLRPKVDNGTLDEIMLDIPTVEAIPKDQYEARLKADMVNMLEEVQDEIFKQSWRLECICDDLDGSAVDLDDINKVIQQKINALKEEDD